MHNETEFTPCIVTKDSQIVGHYFEQKTKQILNMQEYQTIFGSQEEEHVGWYLKKTLRIGKLYSHFIMKVP